jgi:hypothetical protein
MVQRPRLVGICIASLVAFAAICYLVVFAFDWARLYASSLQRFPQLSPIVVAGIQAAFCTFSGPLLLAFSAVAAATFSHRPVLLPFLFAAFAPVHILICYVLLAANAVGWLVFQVLEAGAIFAILNRSGWPNPPLNPDAPPIGGAPVSSHVRFP